jgi:PAS domain S-box-containing protein
MDPPFLPRSGLPPVPVILDALIEGVLLVDQEGRVVWINRPLERLLGIDRNTLHGSDGETFVRRHLGPRIADDACTEQIASSLSPRAGKIELDCTARSPDGREYRVTLSSTAVEDEPFRVMRLVRFQETSAQKQAEDALRQSEETYRQVFASMGMGLALNEMIYDSEGRPVDYRVLDVDPAYECLMGLHRDRIVGRRFTEIYPGLKPPWLERYARALRTQKPVRFEEYNLRSGRWYGIDAYPMREKNRFAVLCTDITAWKQAEEALQESEEKYRTLFESAGDALLIHDLKGRLLDVNRAAVERLGYSREELLTMNLRDIVPLDFAVLVPDRIRKIAETGLVVFETVHLTRDGRRIPVEASARVIPYRGGTAILAISRDVTQRKQAEEELRHQAEMFQRLIDTIPVMIAVFDPELRQFRFNRAFRETLGWTEEDAGSGDFMALIYPDPDYRAEVSAFMRSLEPGWREWKATAKDGSIVESSWANIGLSGDTRIGIGIDLRERNRAEEALRASEERFRRLTENASDLVLVVDAKGTVSYVSPSVRPIGGYAPEDPVGRCILEFVHPDDLSRVRDALRRATAHPNEQVTLEVRVRHRSGSWLYLEAIGNNLLDEPTVRGHVVNARDITRRKRAEEALRASEEQFRLAIRDAPIPIIMYAEGGEVLQISRTWTELTGYTLQDVPTFDAWLTRAYGEGADGVRDHMQALFAGNRRTVGIEFAIRTRDGRTRHWSFSASSPGTLSDGRRFIVGMAVDITERKRSEDALRRRTDDLVRKSEELEAAHDEANIYLDIMTHDVRNANNVSSMYAELLVDLADGDLKAYAEKLRASIDRSNEILGNVATIRRAHEETGLVPVNLDAVIREEIENVPGASIRYSGTHIDVLADGLLPTVVANLIGNAVRHGGPQVEITVRVGEQDGNVLVSVEDTGPGVPDEVKQRLFARFERGTARGSGQGLGLFIVRTLVTRYGGRAWVEDRIPGHPEEGAAFRFTLRKAG